ncbi:MAG: hypothetical protein LAT83_23830 [Kiritimatiellae bacterium]|nr:hypothetical protein [Kiritimatiellia bacterium]
MAPIHWKEREVQSKYQLESVPRDAIIYHLMFSYNAFLVTGDFRDLACEFRGFLGETRERQEQGEEAHFIHGGMMGTK